MDINSNQENLDTLYIKTYSPQLRGHFHNYHQLLIPLRGRITIIIDTKTIIVNYGEILILPKGTFHQFQADENFRFLVVNISDLGFLSAYSTHFCLDDKTLSYLTIIEKQLTSAFNPQINDSMLSLLLVFLQAMDMNQKIDDRLMRVINVIKSNISQPHYIQSLANIACLSESHFKTLFKQQLGCTPLAYITKLRMEMARGLIINTDMPIYLIAEKVGYQNVSSFIRCFGNYFHQTPQQFRQKLLSQS